MSLGKRIKNARKNRGLSQRALAEQVGVSHGTVSRLERKEAKDAQGQTLLAIADVLGTTVDYLLRGGDREWKLVDNGIVDYFQWNGKFLRREELDTVGVRWFEWLDGEYRKIDREDPRHDTYEDRYRKYKRRATE